MGVGRCSKEMIMAYLGWCSLGRWNGTGAGAGAGVEVGQEACFAK